MGEHEGSAEQSALPNSHLHCVSNSCTPWFNQSRETLNLEFSIKPPSVSSFGVKLGDSGTGGGALLELSGRDLESEQPSHRRDQVSAV